jgi:hypothetical protein
MPTPRTVAEIKANLLRPALTSHFEVEIPKISSQGRAKDFDIFLKNNGVSLNQEKLKLMCSETSLPGSSLATHEINNDYMGVTERHAYRRLYDDRADFSFYVDANNYLPIRYFEAWIKWIANESISENEGIPLGARNKAYYYRMKYPDDYVCDQGLIIRKFERDYKQSLEYEFIRAYPISITSMPVSYDASSLLKCSVSFTYLRYIVSPSSGKGGNRDPDSSDTQRTQGYGDPTLEAAYNRANNPLQGNGFADPKVEAYAQAALGGPTLGFADPALERAYQALYNPEPLF